MIGEATWVSRPFESISLVVTDVQPVIASGQIRASDQLVDLASQARAQGSLTVFMEPLFPGEFDRLPPGSSCIANLCTSNHDRLQDPALSGLNRLALYGIDTVGRVHAMFLRLQALLLPVRTRVLSGGH